MKKIDNVMNWLASTLARGALPSAEVQRAAAAAGHSWRTTRRAANDIGIVIRKVGSGWTWQLPEGGHDAPAANPGVLHVQVIDQTPPPVVIPRVQVIDQTPPPQKVVVSRIRVIGQPPHNDSESSKA